MLVHHQEAGFAFERAGKLPLSIAIWLKDSEKNTLKVETTQNPLEINIYTHTTY